MENREIDELKQKMRELAMYAPPGINYDEEKAKEYYIVLKKYQTARNKHDKEVLERIQSNRGLSGRTEDMERHEAIEIMSVLRHEAKQTLDSIPAIARKSSYLNSRVAAYEYVINLLDLAEQGRLVDAKDAMKFAEAICWNFDNCKSKNEVQTIQKYLIEITNGFATTRLAELEGAE